MTFFMRKASTLRADTKLIVRCWPLRELKSKDLLGWLVLALIVGGLGWLAFGMLWNPAAKEAAREATAVEGTAVTEATGVTEEADTEATADTEE